MSRWRRRLRRAVLIVLALIVLGVGPALDHAMTGVRAYSDARKLANAPSDPDAPFASLSGCPLIDRHAPVLDRLGERLVELLIRERRSAGDYARCDTCGRRVGTQVPE